MEKHSLAIPITAIRKIDLAALRPEHLELLGLTFEELKGDNRDVYDQDALDKFLAISDFGSMRDYLAAHTMLYGTSELYEWGEDTGGAVLGALAMRDILDLAMWMYSQGGCFDASRMRAQAGQLLAFASNEPFEIDNPHYWGFMDDTEWTGYHELEFMIGLSPYAVVLSEYLAGARGGAIIEDGQWDVYYFPEPNYCDCKSEAEKAALFEESYNQRNRTLDLREAMKLHEDGYRMQAAFNLYLRPANSVLTFTKVADALMSLHLRGIRTFADDCTEQRLAIDGVSALWWLALDRMRGGRVFQCAACGKVDVATKDRGHKRRFCSDACKQWRSKHRDKDASGNYIEWLPPRR